MGYLALKTSPVFLPICAIRLEALGFFKEEFSHDFPNGTQWMNHLIDAARKWHFYSSNLKHKEGISFNLYGEEFSYAEESVMAETLWHMIQEKKEKVCQSKAQMI